MPRGSAEITRVMAGWAQGAQVAHGGGPERPHVVLGECPRGPTGHKESPRGPMRLRERPQHARHMNFALITFVLTHARKNARPRGRDAMGERVHTRIHVR